MTDPTTPSRGFSRRNLLAMIGQTAGGAAMYHAMTTLGFAAESNYKGPLDLQGAPKGTTVLILGAGMAGLSAAFELRQAGYKVKVLEFNQRAGGRSWTLRGGDEFTELGGAKQRCEFDKGLYINPGPWRLPTNHRGMIDYAKRFKVPLEPFMQVNYNAYVHSKNAYGGKPQRYGHIEADFDGNIAELLSKAVKTNLLDDPVTREDGDKLVEALQRWGALDKSNKYTMGNESSGRRGFAVPQGGGLMPLAVPSQPLEFRELLKSGLWAQLAAGKSVDHHTQIFQPVGGMDAIAQAIYREVKEVVHFGCRVTKIDQDERGVTVTYTDTAGGGDATKQAKADWCVCTIPLSILSQIEVKVGPKMQAAIEGVPYSASVKVGLQFKRRFWEQDDEIYGGITYTDLPLGSISYPSSNYGSSAKGVLLGGYIGGPNAFEFTAMAPADRVRMAVKYGAQIHPQYIKEFDNGIAVAWHRVPFTQGCFSAWNEASRKAHYNNLCQIDGRIVLAGEHASYIPGWQEGAVLSSHDAITRLHARIKSQA